MVSQESSNLQNSAWFLLFQLTKECIKNWVLVSYTKSAMSVEGISQTLLGLPEIEYHQCHNPYLWFSLVQCIVSCSSCLSRAF